MYGWDARFWLAASPVIVIFLAIEWLLHYGRVSFTQPLAFVGTLTISLLGGIFPVLLLAASRQKGEYVPGTTLRLLGHPAVLSGLYIFFVASILLHGLVIWQDPWQRLAALLTGAIILATTGVIMRRGAFRPRTVVELRVDKRAAGLAHFNLVGHGRPMLAAIEARHHGSEQQMEASQGMVTDFQTLQSISFTLPPGAPREVKVWAHQITSEGDSAPLAALLAVRDAHGVARPALDLAQAGGHVVFPATAEISAVELTFAQPAPTYGVPAATAPSTMP
jgi:hypothetical protein